MTRWIATFSLVLFASTLGFAQVKDKKAEKESMEIAEAVKGKMNYWETENFTFCTSKTKSSMAKIGKTAESAFQNFIKGTSVKDWKGLWGNQRLMVVVCANKRAYRAYTKWYAKTYPQWDNAQFIKGHAKSDWFQVVATRRVIVAHFKPHDANFINQVVANQVGFCGANRLHSEQNFIPPWLEEFTGAWVEAKTTGKMVCATTRSNYNTDGDATDAYSKKAFAKFVKKIKSEFKKKRARKVSAMMKKRLHELNGDDLRTGYCLIHFMRSEPKKYEKFIRSLRGHWPGEITSAYNQEKKNAQTTAFKEVFNLTLGGLDKALIAHSKKL